MRRKISPAFVALMLAFNPCLSRWVAGATHQLDERQSKSSKRGRSQANSQRAARLVQPASGFVLDGRGAAVAGAIVTIKDENSGTVRKVATNAEGAYDVSGLPPGSYRVEVEAPGLDLAEIHNVIVQPGQSVATGMELSVGAAVEIVAVTPVAPAVDPKTAYTSASFESSKLRDLPSLTPVESFARLAPGAASQRPDERAGSFESLDRDGGLSLRINGGRPLSTNYSLDGVDNNDIDGRVAISISNFDAADSLQVLTTRGSGDTSMTGASSLNLAARGGTHEYHGTVFDYHLNRALGALSPIERRSGLGEAPEFKNTVYGGTFGGPVVRERVFFFGAFQGESEQSRRFIDATASFLTPTERGLAELASRFAGSRTVADLIERGPLARTIARPQVVRTFSIPVLGSPVEFGQIARVIPSITRGYEAGARLDVNVTRRDTVKLGYWYDSHRESNLTGRLAAGYADGSSARAQLGTFRWSRSLSPRSTSELVLGFNRSRLSLGSASSASTLSVSTGLRGLDYGSSHLLPASHRSTLFHASEFLNRIERRHNIKLGVQARVRATGFDYLPASRGLFSYASFEEFVQDRPVALTVAAGNPASRFTQTHIHLYADDAWRMRRNLTLSFGLSYENAGHPINDLAERIRQRELSPSTALFDISIPLAARTHAKLDRDNNNFAPRFGFAYVPEFRLFGWNIFGYDRTVIRGGVSLSYDQTAYRPLADVAASAPNILLGVLTGAANASLPAFPFVPGASELNSLFDRDPRKLARAQLDSDWRTPSSVVWHLAGNRDFSEKLMIDLGYVGARGAGLIRMIDGNPSLAGGTSLSDSGPLRVYETSGHSSYHSLQAKAELRITNQLTGGLAYTLSKLIDDLPDNSAHLVGGIGSRATLSAPALQLLAQNPFDTDRAERAISSLNRKHMLAGHFVWQLPLRRDQSGVVGRLLGGWQANGIITMASGLPFTPLQRLGYSSASSAVFASAFSERLGALRPFNGSASAPADAVAFSNAANNYFRLFLNADGTPFLSPTGFIIADRSGFRPGAVTSARFIYNDYAVEHAARAMGLPSDAFGRTYAAGRLFGDVGRNILTGPGLANVDFAIVKMTKLSEKVSLQFRSEFFNLFNHPSRHNPNFILENAGGFGFADLGESDASPRRVRLALKLIF